MLDPIVNGCANTEITLHMNYYAKQPGGQSGHELDVCVANTVHTYKVVWEPDKITWHCDTQSWVMLRPTNADWPTQPGRIFLNLWGNSDNNPWAGGMYTGSGNTATVSNLTFVP